MKAIRALTASAALFLAGSATPILTGANVPAHPVKPAQVAKAELANATAESAQYTFISFDAPDSTGTYPVGINDLGVVTGSYEDKAQNFHGFVWRKGKLETIDHPDSTLLGDANNAGTVIGNYGDAMTQHAVTHVIGTDQWTNLPDIEEKNLNAGNGINDLGIAVGAVGQGNFSGSFPNWAGWTWDGCKYSFFHAPDETSLWGTVANAINDRGQIAGAFGDASGIVRGFLKEGDEFTNLDYPKTPRVNTYPTGINNKGVIAGNYWPANTTTNIDDGFVYSNGTFTTVDYPAATASSVNGINDAGDLVGNWFDSKGVSHGFVALRKKCECDR